MILITALLLLMSSLSFIKSLANSQCHSSIPVGEPVRWGGSAPLGVRFPRCSTWRRVKRVVATVVDT
ncbi:hypothetical protein QUB80_03635 [Chlorogloeopsis sp. ULAP01]|nr:hypothetical protein [Chlorogloeopsis sp. ULAP01]